MGGDWGETAILAYNVINQSRYATLHDVTVHSTCLCMHVLARSAQCCILLPLCICNVTFLGFFFWGGGWGGGEVDWETQVPGMENVSVMKIML